MPKKKYTHLYKVKLTFFAHFWGHKKVHNCVVRLEVRKFAQNCKCANDCAFDMHKNVHQREVLTVYKYAYKNCTNTFCVFRSFLVGLPQNLSFGLAN